MKYYIWTMEKTTGPYSFLELKEVLKAFPLKQGSQVISEEQANIQFKLEEL